ncbi:MAG: DMT family transporter [Rhodospirillales bacterium]|nr:DMT family transporter [Rhodospirillales bacterium]
MIRPSFEKWSGYLSGVGTICIWAGFIVFSRMGMVGNLNAFDITALRFVVSFLITVPFVYAYWPRHLPLYKSLILSACGPGALYSMLMFSGLETSPAAYAGVFANGTLPIFTAIIALFLMGSKLGGRGAVAIAIIFAGGMAVGYTGLIAGGREALQGIAYFLCASFLLAVYFVCLQHWKLTPRQAMIVVNVPTALAYLPVWYFFLPSTMASASTGEILFHGLFQGIGPGVLAVLLMAYTVQKLGPTVNAGFAASVPTVAALVAVPVLGEHLGSVAWIGMGAVTVGLLLLLWRR